MSNIITNNINARSGNTITIGKAGDIVSIAGTISYEDVSSVDSVGVITAQSGIHVTGGSVGIGLTDPNTLLHLQGDQPKLRIESTNSLSDSLGTEEIARIEFEATKGNNRNVAASMRVRQDGTWSNIDDFFSPTAIEFYTQDQSGTEITTPRFTINRDGKVGIGTDNPTHEVSIAGSMRVQNPSDVDQFLAITYQGIDFGNTGAGSSTSSTSHLLDDYEEGDWTPFITGATTAGTTTHTEQHGSYTKIGTLVTLRGYIRWTAATGTGQLRIYGIPFVNRTHEFNSIVPGPCMNDNISYPSGYTMASMYMPSGTDHINVYFSGDGVPWSIMQMEGAGSFIFDISYRTV